MGIPKETQTAGSVWAVVGAAFAAVLSVLCCVGPLVLLAVGAGGAWAANLTALAPYRPIFLAIAVGFLGWSFYALYLRPRGTARRGECCLSAGALRIRRLILWIVAVGVLASIALPYAVGNIGRQQAKGTAGQSVRDGRTVKLKVENMTCSGCALAVRKALMSLDGVREASVTLEPPRASVTYDPSRATVGQMTRATARAGFPSSPLKDGQ